MTLVSFTGRAIGPTGVSLSWRTAAELDVLGFNVWRFADGKAVKVNRSLITAKALARAAGATYRLVDRSVRPGTSYLYRLEAVTQTGDRWWQAGTRVRTRN